LTIHRPTPTGNSTFAATTPTTEHTQPWSTQWSPSCSLLSLIWCEGHEWSLHPLQRLPMGTHPHDPSNVGLSFGSAPVSYPFLEPLPFWQLQPWVSPLPGVLLFQPAPLGFGQKSMYVHSCAHTLMSMVTQPIGRSRVKLEGRTHTRFGQLSPEQPLPHCSWPLASLPSPHP